MNKKLFWGGVILFLGTGMVLVADQMINDPSTILSGLGIGGMVIGLVLFVMSFFD